MSNLRNGNDSFGAVILAAGFSSRMKTLKPFLRFDEKRVFIEKIIDDYLEFGCNRIVITINEQVKEWNTFKNKFADKMDSIQFIANIHPEYERFFSIKTGLEFLDNQNFCFIHNADNPFIGNQLLNIIFEKRTDEGYTVPCYQGKGGHPVLFGSKVIKKIKDEQYINVNLKEFLTDFERINVEVDSDKIHININTQEEYEKYFGINNLVR